MRSFLFLAGCAAISALARVPEWEEILAAANETQSWLVEVRRDLHRHPELGLMTDRTSERIAAELRKMGLEPSLGWAVGTREDKRGAGIVVDLTSSEDEESSNGPVVLLRADMDALPIFEETEGIEDFKSTNQNMHACGHDSHTTMLLGATHLLHEKLRGQWQGRIRLMFQPGEEGAFGADAMIEEGVLNWNNHTVNSAFALHVIPYGTSGTFVSQYGALMAGGRSFEIELGGVGGHIGMPAAVRDPVVALTPLLSSIQALPRETMGRSTHSVGLISVSQIHTGGTMPSVVPERVSLNGYMRSVSMSTVDYLADRLEQITTSLTLSQRVNATLVLGGKIYPLENDEELFRAHSALMFQASTVPFPVPHGEFTYGMEDFGAVGQVVPAVMYGLTIGAGGEIPGHPVTTNWLHSPKFALDERVLPRGAAFLAKIAMDELSRLTEKSSLSSSPSREDL